MTLTRVLGATWRLLWSRCQNGFVSRECPIVERNLAIEEAAVSIAERLRYDPPEFCQAVLTEAARLLALKERLVAAPKEEAP